VDFGTRLAHLSSPSLPLVMGVLNVTPDSFSDGGAWLEPGAAVARAQELLADGADLLDVGAESTRPGATPVPEAEEWRRLAPVLQALERDGLVTKISLDTRKPALMLRGADLGVAVLNDVAGYPDPATLRRLAGYRGLSFIAMHCHGAPETMQVDPLPAAAAVDAVSGFFDAATEALTAAGFGPERIWLDPGIGFGKTDGANLRLMAAVAAWAPRRQLVLGVSRKGLLGRALGIPRPADRDAPSKTLELGLAMAGAAMIRTHDVRRLKLLLNLLHGGE
jgi:dihydropteroate synthase